MFYDYKWLLERAYSLLPKEIFEKKRFEIPVARVSIQGNKTIIQNFKEICDVLNRNEKMVMKYILRELATSGMLDRNRLILKGVFTPMKINEKIRKFVKEYVICPECGCPDTVIIKEDRFTFLKCMGCGAKHSIKPIK